MGGYFGTGGLAKTLGAWMWSFIFWLIISSFYLELIIDSPVVVRKNTGTFSAPWTLPFPMVTSHKIIAHYINIDTMTQSTKFIQFPQFTRIPVYVYLVLYDLISL